jgi:hypothetical protein
VVLEVTRCLAPIACCAKLSHRGHCPRIPHSVTCYFWTLEQVTCP